ncbi:class Ib ribonucleoside-diphosphate reductase assembly flavoprotein NrdI [Enterococcus nangangensis]
MDIVYFSVTGQTRRFVEKAGLQGALEITPQDPFISMTAPFVLICPTYDIEITEPVFEFLAYEDNHRLLRGIIGTGNRNFAELFIFTAKDIAKLYNVPILQSFEFAGTHVDVENFRKVVNALES